MATTDTPQLPLPIPATHSHQPSSLLQRPPSSFGQAIGDALKVNSTLQTLNLGRNRLGETGNVVSEPYLFTGTFQWKGVKQGVKGGETRCERLTFHLRAGRGAKKWGTRCERGARRGVK